MPLRLLAGLAAVLAFAAGCSQGPLPGLGHASDDQPADIAEGTCWTGALLGRDPQDVLRMAKKYDVSYLVTARAVATWPAFAHDVPCDRNHALEVYRLVRLPDLDARLAEYRTMLRHQTRLYATVARRVGRACMTGALAQAAARSGLPGAVMQPALPAGTSLSWAPARPEAWTKGRHEFACTLTWQEPQSTRYRSVFTKAFPLGSRTCIDSEALLYVDCARDHDRERIAVIQAADAVAAGAFPGRGAVRDGPTGRHLDVDDAAYARLDAACTAYLRSISTTRRLTGVANVDADDWPTPDGSYPIHCDADRRPDQKSLVTRGSVYDRG